MLWLGDKVPLGQTIPVLNTLSSILKFDISEVPTFFNLYIYSNSSPALSYVSVGDVSTVRIRGFVITVAVSVAVAIFVPSTVSSAVAMAKLVTVPSSKSSAVMRYEPVQSILAPGISVVFALGKQLTVITVPPCVPVVISDTLKFIRS